MRSIDRWRSFGLLPLGGRIAGLALLVALHAGCGSTLVVQQQIAEKMALGDYPGAILIVDEEKEGAYKGRNRILYFLERGMLLHVNGDYAASNQAFEEAKRIGEDLYTRSLSNEGISLMSNDYAIDYAGENYERTLIYLFSALNYQLLGDPDAALVEVRQVGDYLRKLQVDSVNENVYQEDAFARYLSALLYESRGEYDSAFVDYKKAASAYGAYDAKFSVSRPSSLLRNAERVASNLGSWAQNDLEELGSTVEPRVLPDGAGEIVILHYNGFGPIKDQTRYTIPFNEAWLMVAALQATATANDAEEINRATAVYSQLAGVDMVSVVFPKVVRRPYSIASMSVKAEGALEVNPAELVEDIGAIARKDLDDRIARIRTKAIARAAVKYALQKAAEAAASQAGGDYGQLISVATQITGNLARYASEQADKRVWSTLPDRIFMASVVLPAGFHDLSVDFLDARQNVVESRSIPGVEVAPGQREYVIVRTVR